MSKFYTGGRRFRALSSIVTLTLIILITNLISVNSLANRCIELLVQESDFLAKYSLLKNLDSIPKEELTKINEQYRDSEGTFRNTRVWFRELPDILMPYVIHAQNYFQGVKHSQVLAKLGFSFKRDRDGTYSTQMAESIYEIFQKYELRIQELIKSGQISEHEVVRPAFILERRDSNTDNSSYRTFTPVTERWPGAEWTLADRVPQFSHQLYYQFVAQGHMPFAIKNFINHDLSHLSDMYQNTEVMRQYRLYGKYVIASRSEEINTKFNDTSFNTKASHDSLAAERRSVVYGEWFTLPDIGQADKIRRLLPEYFGVNRIRSLDESKAKLHSLTASNLIREAQSFTSSARTLFIALGGGMKDVRSYYVFDSVGYSSNVGGLMIRAFKILKPDPIYDSVVKKRIERSGNEDALFDSIPKMLDMIEFLAKFLSTNQENFEQFLKSKPEYENQSQHYSQFKVDDPGFRQNARNELIDTLARLEMAFAKAVELGLTPEIAYREGRIQRLTPTSKYYQYLVSFTRPNSYTDFAFELNLGGPTQ